MDVSNLTWALTVGGIFLLIAADFFLHRKPKPVSVKVAAWETLIWTLIGLAFGLVVLAEYGGEATGQYYAGYLLERVLSVDNVFVFVVILSFFAVPPAFQHRALLWGVIGALVLRVIFIAAGITLLEKFSWMTYIFGAFLVYTGYKLAASGDEEVHPEKNLILRLMKRIMPVSFEYDKQKLFTRVNGKRAATPMLAVLAVIGTTDLVFALDSIPAILAITKVSYLVVTSNAFALHGLRSMAFLLAGVMDRFAYLKYALALVLMLVGVKMGLSEHWHPNIYASLAVIAAILVAGMGLSFLKTQDQPSSDEDTSQVPATDSLQQHSSDPTSNETK